MKNIVLFALAVLLVTAFSTQFWFGFSIVVLWAYVGYISSKIMDEIEDDVPLPIKGLLVCMGPIALIAAVLTACVTDPECVMDVLREEIPFLKKIKFQSPIVFTDEQ